LGYRIAKLAATNRVDFDQTFLLVADRLAWRHRRIAPTPFKQSKESRRSMVRIRLMFMITPLMHQYPQSTDHHRYDIFPGLARAAGGAIAISPAQLGDIALPFAWLESFPAG
jgi:hypothetical protein